MTECTLNALAFLFITFYDTSHDRHQTKRKLVRLDNPYIVFRIPLTCTLSMSSCIRFLGLLSLTLAQLSATSTLLVTFLSLQAFASYISRPLQSLSYLLNLSSSNLFLKSASRALSLFNWLFVFRL